VIFVLTSDDGVWAHMLRSEFERIVTCISDFRRMFGLMSQFTGYSPVVTAFNDNTLKITVIITNKILCSCFN
jgi:hypothetical protein